MSESQQIRPRQLKFAVAETREGKGGDLPLPSMLRTATRGGGGAVDPLLEGLKVERIFNLAAAARGDMSHAATVQAARNDLLAVETEDGTTLFIRSDALAEAVARSNPEAVDAQGEVDFAQFRDTNATARGLGDVLWKAVSVLRLPDDGLLEEARQKALEWAKEKLGAAAEGKAYDVGSRLGAKALMWKIESRLAGRPGLYRWHGQTLDSADHCLPGDPRLAVVAEGKPALVLIHGTGSYTLGAFADLRADETTWARLEQRFPGGIFGFEHRSFSESPAENALALLDALPKGARVSLLTHSRGGLVGDLLCLGQVKDEVIDAYHIVTHGAEDPAGLELEAREERARLRAIRDRLASGAITVDRYVRVACPARGTRFLSENLDAALSDFLNLLQWGGGALLGATAAALGGPVAGERFGKAASSCLGVVKRLVLEIAGRRIDPRLVPGIAAMRTDSPLAAFLAHPDTRRRDGIRMAVIAGDTEFDGFGFSDLGRRVANLFCDWRLFDRNDNDLVVDTDSMYAGLGFREGAWYLYDQDDSVTHFRYFKNPASRDALRDWLVEADLDRLSQFQPLAAGPKLPWRDRDQRGIQRGADIGAGPRPVVILIPGIMGSHIEIDRKDARTPGSGNRIWFDIPSLLVGGLEKIGDPKASNTVVEDLFEMFYGDLADHLAETHAVVRCPYDWRQPLDQCAVALKKAIEAAARAHPGQPIRLLAHSMGGLVARALMRDYPAAWRQVVDSGGRLVMLGTPNNGSHLMVHTLLGKSDSMRKLEMIDAAHGMQAILDIVAGFPGALALLPRPDGFTDTGHGPEVISPADYYQAGTWRNLKNRITDRWYGDGVCGLPASAPLEATSQCWRGLPTTLPDLQRVAYVYGQSDKTPCGVQLGRDGRVKLLFTPFGDGSVTWQSGRMEGLEERSWYMPVEHADLTGEADYFPAIVELLDKGGTDKLGRLPRARGEVVSGFVLEAEPPVMADAEELARAFMGSGPRRRKAAKARQALRVAVRAGDLSYIDQPVLCGHYIGDAISGAEAAMDRMLNGSLSERERLGVYAGDIGSSAIVLRPPSGEDLARGSLKGALIVGLGPFTGQLSARQVTETVRAAVLRYLLQLRDALNRQPEQVVQLYSVLIGWGSTSSISVAESVAAITRGVLEANRQFRDVAGRGRAPTIAVSDLCFIELYRDAAISAAQAVLDLPEQLANDLGRLGARLEPAASLRVGEGVVERLYASSDLGHWSRLIVTDADASDIYCAPECYEPRYQSPMPPEALKRLCRQSRCIEGAEDKGEAETADDGIPADAPPGESRYYPERLKYLFLSQRARAETVWQRRQPGLIEDLIRKQRHNPGYDAKLGHTLFQLMVPLDYKAAAREQSRLLLVLDGYTANLPWELLQADGEALVLRIPMIRQLATSRYRPTVRTANTNAACIIVNPATDGFHKRFPGKLEKLVDLKGAEREGLAIAASLRNAGWSEIVITPPEREALDIFNVLYERPYRVLMIGAHGLFEAQARDGRAYSGVVLSDGLLITAVEISQMETVPEVVFLSCCHLGSISNPYSQPNRLAYSLARELIEMGVRCVVAAGWEVNDDAACTFARIFFDGLCGGQTFGDAIFQARKRAYRDHPGSNTWGAYQAYGDPGYRLRADSGGRGAGGERPYVAQEELLAEFHKRRLWRKGLNSDDKRPCYAQESQWARRQLARCPPDWAERPDVLQTLGEFFGDLGADGFEAARDAYRKAIQREDQHGRVALRTIEQLANMEARHGERLTEQGDFAKGLALIESGIRRMRNLADTVGDAGTAGNNAERAAILGSAYKLNAYVLAKRNRPWREVSALLGAAAQAYRSAPAGDAIGNPYNTLNYLPLAWLSDTLPQTQGEAIELARRCGEIARKKFTQSMSFWDAVMSADADMTAWLMGGALPDSDGDARPAQAMGMAPLKRRYDDVVGALPQSAREWDSVVKQWRLLVCFLRLRGTADDPGRADVLEALANQFGPAPTRGAADDSAGASGPPTVSTAADNAATGGGPAKKRKPRQPKQG